MVAIKAYSITTQTHVTVALFVCVTLRYVCLPYCALLQLGLVNQLFNFLSHYYRTISLKVKNEKLYPPQYFKYFYRYKATLAALSFMSYGFHGKEQKAPYTINTSSSAERPICSIVKRFSLSCNFICFAYWQVTRRGDRVVKVLDCYEDVAGIQCALHAWVRIPPSLVVFVFLKFCSNSL